MALKKKLADLHDRIDMMAELNRLNHTTSVSVWRDKPVIPLSKWLPIQQYSFKQALAFFPDGYADFNDNQLFSAQASGEFNSTEFEVWRTDHFAFLEHKGNRVCGRQLCTGCLLNPSKDPFGLRKIISNVLSSQRSLQQTNAGNSSSGIRDLTPDVDILLNKKPRNVKAEVPYPCKVVNRFECPYRKAGVGYDDEKLVEIGTKLNAIEDALFFASERIDTENIGYMDRYEVDFDKDIVKYGLGDPLTGKIVDLPTFKAVTIRGIQDIYNVLTSPELLDKVLFQYFASEVPNVHLKHHRSALIALVASFKDKIKTQDLYDGFGGTLEDSEERNERIQERAERLAWPSAQCCICKNDLCQIKCSNCNVYMCKNDWQEHMEEKHEAMAQRYLSLF